MTYLIDTDWLIDGIIGIPSALSTLASLRHDGVAVSIISFGELYEGVWLGPDPDANLQTIRRFLDGFEWTCWCALPRRLRFAPRITTGSFER